MTEQLLDHNPADYEFNPNDLDPADFDDFDAPANNLDTDTFESFFIDPEQTAITREAERMSPIDEALYQTWLTSLPDERRQYLEATRGKYLADKERIVGIHDKLTALVPELYDAKLPAELEKRLDDWQYAIGFNQSKAYEEVGTAAVYLKEHQGVDITGYDLTHRFLMFDGAMSNGLGADNSNGIAAAIESGYFGDSTMGRIVAAFPVEEGAELVQERLSDAINLHPELTLPDDARVDTPEGISYANKYIAGFIDGNGDFWINKEFAVSNKPNFDLYERPLADVPPTADNDDFM